MKKLIFSAIVALSCSFVFASNSNTPSSIPNWTIYFVGTDAYVFWDGSTCKYTILINNPYGDDFGFKHDGCVY